MSKPQNTCTACKALRALGVSCNAHRASSPTAFDRVNAAAVREYLASGPLSAERVAQHDAAVRES